VSHRQSNLQGQSRSLITVGATPESGGDGAEEDGVGKSAATARLGLIG